eukprot:TRINITY_DN4842_c0_g1_i1.p1 TRINITY_DN4842_c0_g1~~TRINITY_DN4842_c0_g1_i1.p1  ORF type:complete len:383 (+),score=76.68 TRINITY_DN4842_c0_g1_i1:203-1351(+)
MQHFDQTAQPTPARILATGAAFPPQLHKQSDVVEAFVAAHRMTPEDEAFTRRIFKNTMIETNSIYLPQEMLFKKMTKNEYVRHIKPKLFDLGLRAATQAISEWGGRKEDITHFVWGTMTGSIHAPTMDILLTNKLGLRHDVQRLSIEGMGCLTGFRCLGLAADLAKGNRNAVILVIVADIRSAIGNQLTHHEDFSPIDRSNVIVSALFRDAGTAAIVSARPPQGDIERPLAVAALPEYYIVDHLSSLLPETEHLALYQEKDNSELHLFLDRLLPDAIFKSIAGLVATLLAPHGVTPDKCHFFSHTGGPKILRGVQAVFDVPIERLASSWHIMKTYGNLSGSSNIAVVDHARRSGEPIEWAVCAAFGPGISVECVLLRRVKGA